MDYYDIWFNLKDPLQEAAFCADLDDCMRELKVREAILGYRLRRRTLGLGPSALGEFNLTIDLRDLAQLDALFRLVEAPDGEVHALYQSVMDRMADAHYGLSRDYPGSISEVAALVAPAESPEDTVDDIDLATVEARREGKKHRGPPGGPHRKKRRRWPGPLG